MNWWNGQHWRTKAGIVFTACWVFIAVIVFLSTRTQALGPNGIGDFLAGFAAPLAFVWLLLGYAMQVEELGLQRDQLTLQKEEVKGLRIETEKQRQALQATELNSRRDTFLKVHDLASQNLVSIAIRLLWFLYEHTDVRGRIAGQFETVGDFIIDTRFRFTGGERDIFYDECLIALNHLLDAQTVFTKDIRFKSEAEKFVDHIEWLMAFADQADGVDRGVWAMPLKGLRNVLEHSRASSMYAGLCLVLGRAIKFKDRYPVPEKLDQIVV